MFVLIGQNLHGTVTNINQIDQHFNSLTASHHIVTKRPESFLFIVACFNIPAKRIQQQWNVFHPVTASLIQWCFFLTGAEKRQIFRKNRTEKQSFCTMLFFRGSAVCMRLLSRFGDTSHHRFAGSHYCHHRIRQDVCQKEQGAG